MSDTTHDLAEIIDSLCERMAAIGMVPSEAHWVIKTEPPVLWKAADA